MKQLVHGSWQAASGRRAFLRRSVVLAVAPWLFAACAPVGNMSTEPERARKRQQIETTFYTTLERAIATLPGTRALIGKAVAVLAFPSIVEADPLTGEQSGMGALRVGNVFYGYYLLTLAQPAQAPNMAPHSVIFLFMTFDALNEFKGVDPWRVVDTPVATPTVLPGGRLDITAPFAPLLALVFGENTLLTDPPIERFIIRPLGLLD